MHAPDVHQGDQHARAIGGTVDVARAVPRATASGPLNDADPLADRVHVSRNRLKSCHQDAARNRRAEFRVGDVIVNARLSVVSPVARRENRKSNRFVDLIRNLDGTADPQSWERG